jgi:hypothetical protein
LQLKEKIFKKACNDSGIKDGSDEKRIGTERHENARKSVRKLSSGFQLLRDAA